MKRSVFQLWATLVVLLLASHHVRSAKRSITLPLHTRIPEGNEVVSRRKLLRNTTLPLHGAVKDYGYFYASLYLGSPPKKFAVIVDTGSTMTYVPCATCGSACGPNHQDAAFDPRLSQTAKIIPCSSDKCKCGSPHCACSDAQQCMYTRSYAEQSSSSGILLEDIMALHDGGPGVPIIFGCETRETGEIFKQRADGLFGLGNSDASVVNQLAAANEIDDVFSLCFGVVEGDGVLMLGDAPAASSVPLHYTPLVRSETHPFYYNVNLRGISVGGDLLDLQTSLFQEGYGTVLDSGTTFTYVPTVAFTAFANAVEAYALDHGLQRVRGPDPQYDDICFGGAPEHTDPEALAAVFPSFGLHFAPNVTLTLDPLNYLFVHTFNSGKYCLGVFDNGNSGTLLGGITFRNVLVQYDRARGRVGFGKAACKDLGQKHRPPCSAFANDGNELAAIVAVADGDCQPDDPSWQQQQIDKRGVDDDYMLEGDEVLIHSSSGSGDNSNSNNSDENSSSSTTTVDNSSDNNSSDGDGSGSNDEEDEEQEIVGSTTMHDSNEDGEMPTEEERTTDAGDVLVDDQQQQQQQGGDDSSSNSIDSDTTTTTTADDTTTTTTEQQQPTDATTNDDNNNIIDNTDDANIIMNDIDTDTLQPPTHNNNTKPLTENPVLLVLVVTTIVMLTTAMIAALFRPGPREAIQGLLPSFRRYQPLDGDDPEHGTAGGTSGGGTTSGTKGALGGTGGGGGAIAGVNSVGVGLLSSLSTKSSGDATSTSTPTAGMIASNKKSGTTAPATNNSPGGTVLVNNKANKPLPTIAVIAMTDISSKNASQTGVLHGGEKRVVGLTTPQKLQRTNSNSAAAAAAAALAEELAAAGAQGLTPRSAASSSLVAASPSARLGGGRPTTPTRLQLQQK